MMATWITHLRIAETIIHELPNIDEVFFLYGNLAPDCGTPNEDRTKYDPPKEFTHFLHENNGEEVIKDLVFYRDYLEGIDVNNEKMKYSFRLGYFVHLLTDQLWWDKIVTPTKKQNQELFSKNSLGVASAIVKTDWYDLDHKFLLEHPGYEIWESFYASEIPLIPLPFMSQNAFECQMKYIKEYYTTPDPERILIRRYPYLNAQRLDGFITETSIVIKRILQDLAVKNIQLNNLRYSETFLLKEETLADPSSLGDPF